MGNVATLLLIGGAVLAYNAFTKYNASGALNFYPANANSLAFDGTTPVLTVGVAVSNPTNTAFTIRGFSGTVTANDYMIGVAESYETRIIQPRANTVLPIQIRLGLVGIAADIVNAITSGNKFSQVLKLSATANVDNFNVPVKLTYKIP